MSRPPRPPRIPEWLLGRVLPPGIVREDIVGSLAEEHAARARRVGGLRADAWYWRQALGIAGRAAAGALRVVGREGTKMETGRELWQASRRLGRAPLFALAVIATVAVGIGGTTAVFGLVHGVLVRPLPYPSSERLVWLRNARSDGDFSFSMVDYLALEKQQTVFDAVAAYDPNGITLTTTDGSERLQAHMVTSDFLPLLGIRPRLGRGISTSDTRPGADRVALLSDGVWRSRFGSDPEIVGRTITLDQRATTVVGVLPPPVGPLERDRDFLLPLTLSQPDRKGPFFLRVVGRLAEGSSREAASEQLVAISDRIFPIWEDDFPDATVHWGMRDLKEAVLGDVGVSLWIAMTAVGGLLLIALTNAANLLVARATEQQRASAVRIALGAGAGRMLWHRLSESIVLSALGGAAGLALAFGAIHVAAAFGAGFIPRVSEAEVNGAVLAFLASVTAVSVIILGLAPLGPSGSLLSSLRGGDRSGVAVGSRRLRRGLVVAQLALTVPLLVGGTLLGSSLHSLRRVDPGFRSEGLMTARVTLPLVGYEEASAQQDFWHRVLAEIRALPGVEAAGRGNGRPPDEPGFGNNFVLEDVPLAPGASQPSVPWTIADPAYFEALGVEVVAGSMFDTDADSARVALVDETWARRFFGDPGEAVGRRFVHGGCTDRGSCPWWTVIGVVGDVEYNGVAVDDVGAMYLDAERFSSRYGFLLVRVAGERATDLAPAVRGIVRDIDPRVPVTDVATGSELMAAGLRADRYLTGLVAVFGGVALILSLVGVYGVVAYFVQDRRRDIGIRMALGGQPRAVAVMVMGTTMRFVLAGVVAGTVVAFGLAGLMDRVLFQVDSSHPWSFLLVAATMGLAGLMAAAGPAVRAARLDPVATLKEE